jgi:hypothetical protein
LGGFLLAGTGSMLRLRASMMFASTEDWGFRGLHYGVAGSSLFVLITFTASCVRRKLISALATSMFVALSRIAAEKTVVS